MFSRAMWPLHAIHRALLMSSRAVLLLHALYRTLLMSCETPNCTITNFYMYMLSFCPLPHHHTLNVVSRKLMAMTWLMHIKEFGNEIDTKLNRGPSWHFVPKVGTIRVIKSFYYRCWIYWKTSYKINLSYVENIHRIIEYWIYYKNKVK